MAAGFSGSGTTADRIEAGTPDVPASTGALSIMAWGKPNSIAFKRYMSKAADTGPNDHTWMLSGGTGSVLRSRINAGGSTTTVSAGAIVTSSYRHGAAIYDGTDQTNYVNAVSGGSGTNSGDIDVDATMEYWIGNQPPTGTTGTEVWDGDLEDVRIYARELSLAELETIFNSNGHDGIVHSMILRHPLNDNSSGTIGTGEAHDLGSLQVDGDGVNSPTWEVGENIAAPRRRYR